MRSCITCGMPLEDNHAGDIGLQIPEGYVCKFDSVDGCVKDGRDIFLGGVSFFMTQATGGDRKLAERLARRNMGSLPYWQAHPFPELVGPVATDEEFQVAMSKL